MERIPVFILSKYGDNCVMTFEEALKRLGEISEQMENPDITLKSAVELYSEAGELTEICKKNIEEAKLALEKIEQ